MVYMFLRNYVVAPVVNRVCRPTVIGLEHVPSHGPAILASNHLSVPDTIFMPVAVPRQVFFLAKSEYFNTPGLKGRLTAAFFKAINQIPMDRRGGQASAKSLSAGARPWPRASCWASTPRAPAPRTGGSTAARWEWPASPWSPEPP